MEEQKEYVKPEDVCGKCKKMCSRKCGEMIAVNHNGGMVYKKIPDYLCERGSS